MKKIILILTFLCVISVWKTVFAFTDLHIEASWFIAQKGIINDNSADITQYKLNENITRREMLKVMMNLSWKQVIDQCTGKFWDIQSQDWGCKYAEAALSEWFIAANSNFRPNDNVTQIEALKMIMQAKWIQRDENSDWKKWYISKGQSEWLIREEYLDTDKNGLRSWIFLTAALSYNDFSYNDDIILDEDTENFFNMLLN